MGWQTIPALAQTGGSFEVGPVNGGQVGVTLRVFPHALGIGFADLRYWCAGVSVGFGDDLQEGLVRIEAGGGHATRWVPECGAIEIILPPWRGLPARQTRVSARARLMPGGLVIVFELPILARVERAAVAA